MSATPVLAFQHVARSFIRSKPVLADVTFSMDAGEVVALLGRNGTGKTTLMQIAMGMLVPEGGSVRVFGLSPTQQPVAVKKRIGYVAENQVLPAGSSLRELLAFHRRLFPTWDDALERELLDRFGLSGNRSAISIMSKGQGRQVALICAVCHRPELLILDEPGGGLDPAARREFLETSIQLLNREGTAILFSSHHMGDVERLGGRVVLLDQGRVRLDRDLDDLREHHCVVVIPAFAVGDTAAVEAIDGCLNVRFAHDAWHAVFRGAPEDVGARVRGALGLSTITCASVPLEEFFVELVGGERMSVTP